MGLTLRNAEYHKIPVELSGPEDASHLWKFHIYRD